MKWSGTQIWGSLNRLELLNKIFGSYEDSEYLVCYNNENK